MGVVRPLRSAPLVRLDEADPHWVVANAYDAAGQRIGLDQDKRHGMGVGFECPIHSDGCYVAVMFRNPTDGGPPDAFARRYDYTDPKSPKPLGWGARACWERVGESFATMTLSPSIRVLGGPDNCEWHGFIRSGLFETCPDSK